MLESEKVRSAARGKWDMIYGRLAPELGDAMTKMGRHVTCPVHGTHNRGGKGDGFRLFTERGNRNVLDPAGGGICNSCGAKPDGFALLMWLKGWDFPKALKEVAGALGVEETRRETRGKSAERPAAKEFDAQGFLALPPAPAVMVGGNYWTVPAERQVAQKPAEPAKKPVQQQMAPSPAQSRADQKARERLQRTWKDGVSLLHPSAEPARRWLKRRGLEEVLRSEKMLQHLRYHPNLAYRSDAEERIIGHFPAIIALVLDPAGRPVTIHRTYLSNDGRKASEANQLVDECRKVMSYPSDRSLSGAAVRLGDVQDVLGVAEGLETAIAVFLATGIVCWPCLTTSYMKNFVPPEGVRQVIVFADKDLNDGGERAAKELVQRLWNLGLQARIATPQAPIPSGSKKIDWNDVLVRYGKPGFASVTARAPASAVA